MRLKIVLLILLGILLLAWVATAQTVVGDRFRLNAGPCIMRSGSGVPTGAVTGSVCDTYLDSATGVLWEKWSGVNTTAGWNVGHNANAAVNGNLTITGFTGLPGYVSQLTGWRITNAGTADFRYVYTDELHAKSFIADLEQALAGGQLICKSVTSLANNFAVPATAFSATITVRDLPSAPNVAVFQEGDYVGIRNFTRTAGSLTISDAYAIVTGYADQSGGNQTWNFSRQAGVNGGGMPTGTIVNADSIIIDYGVSGNGCYETNAIDGLNGVNSPYAQSWTWTTSPIAANRTLRTRTGNLTGITGTVGEYGSVLGTYGTGAAQYVKASTAGVDLHNVNLNMFSGATEVIRLDRTVPSLAMGAAVPPSYAAGTGLWMGNDAGAYKFRVGTPNGAGLFWDGASLVIRGTAGSSTNMISNSECKLGTTGWSYNSNAPGALAFNVNLGGASDYTPEYPLLRGGTCFLTNAGVNTAGTVSYIQTAGGSEMAVIGGRRYEFSAYLGVYRVSYAYAQINYFDVTGAIISSIYGPQVTSTDVYRTGITGFVRAYAIGDAPAAAKYAAVYVVMYMDGVQSDPYLMMTRTFFGEATTTQTEPSPWGPAGVTEITGGMIQTGTILASHIAANTITAGQIAAGTITATQIAANTITAAKIAANTITAAQIQANSIGATEISVTNLAAINAALGTITSGSLRIGTGGTCGATPAFFVRTDGSVEACNGIDLNSDVEADELQLFLSGSGTRTLCVDGSHNVFASAGPC